MSVKLARETVGKQNDDKMREEIAKNLDYLRKKGLEWINKTSVDFPTQINKKMMNEMQVLQPKYIEVIHQDQVDAVKDNYVMIQSFKLSIKGDWTCPAKTIAIFAHNTEFSF